MDNKDVYYVWDVNLIEHCDRLPAVSGRASMVHNLISAYDLIKKLKIVISKPADESDLLKFHSNLYIKHLNKFSEVDEEYITNNEDEEYGIGYDCPPVPKMSELVSALAGGSITAARCLTLGLTQLVLNWCGGWHHANRHGAEGFCYINDIVLAIEYLKEKFPKVLYIDLDVHHGNGVQDAYSLSTSVFTLSIHKYEPGFYPGTGDVSDIGTLVGKGYSCNVPLHAFYSDDTLEYVFEKVFETVFALFAPDAIVVQCGADALAGDPNGGAGVTARGFCACVSRVLDKKKPTMLLGGGGYKHSNTARLWTSLTALATGVTLDENIPEHSHWPDYGPDYMLAIQPMLSRDVNKRSYIDDCIEKIQKNLRTYLKPGTDKSMTAGQSDSGLTEKQEIKTNRKNTFRIPSSNQPTEDIQSKEDVYTFTE